MAARSRPTTTAEISRIVSEALTRGEDPNGIATALFDATPELVDRRCAHAHVERSYDTFHNSRPELEVKTAPFECAPAVVLHLDDGSQQEIPPYEDVTPVQ